MKIITSAVLILMLSACNKEQNRNHTLNNDNFFRQEPCACEKAIKTDTIISATDIRLKKEAKNITLVFRCASIVTGTASVSDVHGNNEHCEALYDVQCVSSVDARLQLSGDFKYFTDQLRLQQLFFEDLKSNAEYYFEFRLDKDRKINSISRLPIR
ncbi:hypothetical protein [Chryseobacterium indologenes]|nr:hypothetical protein [Chryseobacterium indologenes]